MTSFRFSATRFQRSVKIFAALGAFCFSVAITILLCGGSTFLDPQLVEPFRITKDVFFGGQLVKAGEIDNGSKTFFLFPGRVDLMLAGAFYIATLSIFLFASAVVAVGSTYYMCTLEQEQLSRDQKFIVCHPFVVLFALPLAPLILEINLNKSIANTFKVSLSPALQRARHQLISCASWTLSFRA
jgi:hypothetical protein